MNVAEAQGVSDETPWSLAWGQSYTSIFKLLQVNGFRDSIIEADER